MYRLLSTSVARSLNEQSRRKYATLWLRHGCPWSIGFGDPRSQKRDPGHPSRFSFGFGWKGKFTYGLEPVPFKHGCSVPMQTVRHLMIPTQSNRSQTCAGTSSHNYVRTTKLPPYRRFLAARRARNYPFHASPPRVATSPASHFQTLPLLHRCRVSPAAP